MTDFSILPFQTAIYERLSGDTALMNLISGVFDRPPQETAFPYLTIGDATAADWSTKTTSGSEVQATIQVWSREGGRSQAAAIMERVYQLLHDANFSVSGHTMTLIRWVFGGISLESDGVTYHGVMRFRALLEAN